MVKKIRQQWNEHNVAGQNRPSSSLILVGAPDDRGVSNVGGRLGAGNGPQATRQMLGQFMLGMHGELEKTPIYSGFDIELGASIEEGHQNARKAVAAELRSGTMPIFLGGGHDYGFAHLAGVADALQTEIAVINVDAHLDLRPPNALGITSGSPFFLAIEGGLLTGKNLVEFGIQEHCNDKALYKYASDKKIAIHTLQAIRESGNVADAFEKILTKFTKKKCPIVVSFDVDAVQAAHAPGVSAPQSDGFTPAEFFSMVAAAGRHRTVASIGFFEFAPALDRDQQTARLVATAIHRFASEFSRRDELLTKQKNPVRRLLNR